MKPFLLFAFLLLACSSTFSQTYKNQWLVGGSGSFTRQTSTHTYSDRYKYTFINVSPDAGYFVITNLAVGARLGLDYTSGHNTFNDAPDNKYRSTTYSAAPFVRYYFLKANHRINILADATYKWYWYTSKNMYASGKSKNKGYAFAAGAAWFISPHAALELTAGYGHTDDFNSNTDFSLNIGFHQHLGKGQQKKKS